MNRTTKRQHAAALDVRRHQVTRGWLGDFRGDQARRLAATRALFDEPVVIIDPHTHSEHSDGNAPVAANHAVAAAAGIDILFATDHGSLGQKRDIRARTGASWGQEPGALHHHIGLLCNTRLFKPRRDRLDLDIARARRLAPFVWIPHPAGWYPGTVYSEEQKAALWTLAPAFAMEVLNGAHHIGTAFDRFDEAAVALWDRLLADGIRVTPLGGSDAHIPESIGCCWTAVPDARPTAASVIEGLNAGRCLASEGPLLALWIEGRPMGSDIRAGPGKRVRVRFRAADAAGLQCVRLVADGRAVKTVWPRDAAVVEEELMFAPGRACSLRLEARAVDNRRAFAAPLYFARQADARDRGGDNECDR